MGEENNILMGPGTLYIYPPEGGGALPLGEIRTLEITPDSMDPADDFGTPLVVAPPISETWTFEMGTVNLRTLWYLTRDMEIIFEWARVHRPRLLHLSRRAKRPRARGKNFMRIIREFLEG